MMMDDEDDDFYDPADAVPVTQHQNGSHTATDSRPQDDGEEEEVEVEEDEVCASEHPTWLVNFLTLQ